MTKSNWQKLKTGEMRWDVFHRRAEILQAIRQFFDTRGYLEVEPPLLSPYPSLDANIHSIPSSLTFPDNKTTSCYLHTSPEHAMKKMLAGGAQKIYFLGRVFRNGELSPLHNPEFTMLEWYRTHADYQDIMAETETLINHISDTVFSKNKIVYRGERIDLSVPWKKTTIRDLFYMKTGIDLAASPTLKDLQESAVKLNIHYDDQDDWDSLFFRLFLEKIESGLGLPNPEFIMDYPAHMGQMAKLKTGDKKWAERVELYIAGIELANGYSELLNPDEQERRFLHAVERKQRETGKIHPVDYDLIEALKTEIPPTAGIALGVDRLLMFFMDKKDIRDVLMFSQHNWK